MNADVPPGQELEQRQVAPRCFQWTGRTTWSHGSPHPFSRVTSRVEDQKTPVFIGSSRVHGSSPPRVSPSPIILILILLLILISTLIRSYAPLCAFVHWGSPWTNHSPVNPDHLG